MSIPNSVLTTLEPAEKEKAEAVDTTRLAETIASLPLHVQGEFVRQQARLRLLRPEIPEYEIVSTYLRNLLGLPWTVSAPASPDIQTMRARLDELVYGLPQAKQRITEYLAIQTQADGEQRRGIPLQVLCLVGSAGMGKTTVARAIASALGRPYETLSLAGVSDYLLRGRRRSTTETSPGLLIETIRRSGVNNPVIIVEDIDSDKYPAREAVYSVLLEALDPARNSTFRDTYLDLPFDLSGCIFICTAASIEDMPRLLRRMLFPIHLSTYTEDDKIQIAQRFIAPRCLSWASPHGVDLRLEADALRRIIREQTDERGLSELERRIVTVYRQAVAMKQLGEPFPDTLTSEHVDSLNLSNVRRSATFRDGHHAPLHELPDYVREEIERQQVRLRNMVGSPDYGLIEMYIDYLRSLPWMMSAQEHFDLHATAEVLDREFYGLEHIKKRVIEYLVVRMLLMQQQATRIQPPVLCLVGPPGVGKTGLARSVALALNRPFVRVALGGVFSEAEMRGHRRTYMGAYAGRVMEGIRRAAVNNPVMLLDEIDKTSGQGSVQAALLEVLDPEQNATFFDNYVSIPFSLSHCLFICTANDIEKIAPPLLDRMETVVLPGYTEQEKLHIAQRFLVPRQRDLNGLREIGIEMTDDTIVRLISEYTHEAGVRDLERHIASTCRRIAVLSVTGEPFARVVQQQDVEDLIGPPQLFLDSGEADRRRHSGKGESLRI